MNQPPPSAARLAPGVIVAGKYRLEAALARGGMGSVWTARHVQLDAQVAIKFMDASFASSPTSRSRFEREAKASAAIRSPHVVNVTDYGYDAGSPYLVMELLRGEDLGARLQRERRMSIPFTANVVAQIAKGLRKAHEVGLVHRDLKPGNIYLARVDDEEVVKILDFGIAKDTASQAVGESTKTGEVVGSPHYMSPEQIRCVKDLDGRSDIWALGVITFRMLTGRLPFMGQEIGVVLAQVLADPIPVATQIAPDLPPALDHFFSRALARDRNVRFATVKEMADELSAIASGSAQLTTVGLGPPMMAPRANTTMPLTPVHGAPGPLPPAQAPAARQPMASAPPYTPSFSPAPFPAVSNTPYPPPQQQGVFQQTGTNAQSPFPSVAPPHDPNPPTPASIGGIAGSASAPLIPIAPTKKTPLIPILAGSGALLALVAGAALLMVSGVKKAPPEAIAQGAPVAQSATPAVTPSTMGAPPKPPRAADTDPATSPTVIDLDAPSASAASPSASAKAPPPKETAKAKVAPPPPQKPPSWGF